jgi:hypothetical protein
MKPIKLNYSAFQPLDCYLTHSNKLVGRIIRFAETEKFDPKDDATPNHAGLIFPVNSQFLCCEMSPRLVLTTPENYTGKHEQIIQVWRYTQWEPAQRQAAIEHLAYLIRKNQEQVRYDPWGAILSSPLGKKLFGWMPFAKNRSDRWFCSEMVSDILRKYADPLIPEALSPLDLSLYFQRTGKPKYVKVEGWKV